jgi:hypothetical protein
MQRNQYTDNIQVREGEEKTDKTGQLARGNRKIYKRWCVLGEWFVTFERTVVPSSYASNPRRLLALKIREPQHRSTVTF